MRRRDLLGAAAVLAATLPFAASAQQASQAKRVGVILPATADDAEYQTWAGAFLQALAQLGWNIGSNLRIDFHWATSNATGIRKHVVELLARSPDVILAAGASTVGPVLQETRTVPVVFPTAVDPVAAGFVESLARPGGNATGFLLYEYSLGGKWLELLRQIAPQVVRVGVLRDPTTPSGTGQLGAIQAAASSFGVEVQPVNIRDEAELQRDIAKFAASQNGGLILTGSGPSIVFHELIIRLAANHKIPAVYYERFFAAAGGLISYGADRIDQYRRAAGYVDRILRGDSPSNLPVQAPTKYELVINLKTARALGLAVPTSLLARADEVLE